MVSGESNMVRGREIWQLSTSGRSLLFRSKFEAYMSKVFSA